MALRTWHIAAGIVLLVGLGVSLACNLYPLDRSPTGTGSVDSKSNGQGTDQRGEVVTWYTVSLALVTEDKKNHFSVGHTIAHVIDKENVDRIQDDTVVEWRPRPARSSRVSRRRIRPATRVVLREARATGTMDGKPFTMQMLQELEPAGAGVAPSTTGPGSCREFLDLLVSIDEGSTEEPAVATSYRCMSVYVDSTAQYPSKAPSLALTQGVPLSLRLGVERKPVALELRLYSGAGIYGSFGNWPEELFFTDQEPVETLHPTPSLALQYLPQQSPGEYTLVVRATWDGPIAVFYAISLRLQ